MARVKGDLSPQVVRRLKAAGLDAYTLNPPHPEGHTRQDASYIIRRWPRPPRWPSGVFRPLLIRRCIFGRLSRQASVPDRITQAQYYPLTFLNEWTWRDLLMRTAYAADRILYPWWYDHSTRTYRTGYKYAHDRWTACPDPHSAQWFPYSLHWYVYEVPPRPPEHSGGYALGLGVRLSQPYPQYTFAHFWAQPPTPHAWVGTRRGRKSQRGVTYYYRDVPFSSRGLGTLVPYEYQWASLPQWWPGMSLPTNDLHVVIDGYDAHGHTLPPISATFVNYIPPYKHPTLWLWEAYPLIAPWQTFAHKKRRSSPFFPGEILGVQPP